MRLDILIPSLLIYHPYNHNQVSLSYIIEQNSSTSTKDWKDETSRLMLKLLHCVAARDRTPALAKENRCF